MDLTGRVAIITGGTGALGTAVVSEFASAGATVVVPYRRESSYAALRQELGDLGARVHGQEADVADQGAVAALVEATLDQHQQIDILLNLVGGYDGGRFAETDLDLWDRMLRLNLRSTVVCTRAVLPHMLERDQGRIVTIGAKSALDPSTGSSAYAAAKAAVISMTQTVAREIRASGVTINCVAPSTIDTEENRRIISRADPSRWVKPSQIAALLRYLCSDAAAAINGAVIPVYGKV